MSQSNSPALVNDWPTADRRYVNIHREIPMNVDPALLIGKSRCMTNENALSVLSAIAHPARLATFKLLVRHEPVGLTTGEIAHALAMSQSTFSTHLAILAKAKLVRAEKQGRNQIQRADMSTLRALMVFLAKDCCQGSPELCEPLLAELTCC
jgi:DNA-binding transcriptional ArsR family regulator